MSSTKKPKPKEPLLLIPGFPVEFVSSIGRNLSGVLVEEDAMYEAWHVRLAHKVQLPGSSIHTDMVAVMTHDLCAPKSPIVPVKILKTAWTCPHCGADNTTFKGIVLPVMGLTCFNCNKAAEGVLTDSNHEILREGQPFPE